VGLTGGVALLAAFQIALAQDVVSQDAALTRQLPRTPVTLRVAPQRPDLVRYNRVEALSLGARIQARPATPLGPLSLTAISWLALADPYANGRLDVAHENLDRRIVLSGYRELAAIDESARHFGLANSLTAVLAGHDDGDYYLRSGATVEWTPMLARPRTFRLRVFAEYHEAVRNQTNFQLPRLWDDDASFRANIEADEVWEYGASLELARRWGTDARRTRGGTSAFIQAATGDVRYTRASLRGDVTFPLRARIAFSFEAEGGTSWGSPSTQRLWYVGGPMTLRAYWPRALGGGSFGRARAELGRSHSFARVVLFTDMAWAGERSDLDPGDALYSAGLGFALIDDILRLDGSWQLRSPHWFRIDLYFDQIL